MASLTYLQGGLWQPALEDPATITSTNRTATRSTLADVVSAKRASTGISCQCGMVLWEEAGRGMGKVGRHSLHFHCKNSSWELQNTEGQIREALAANA